MQGSEEKGFYSDDEEEINLQRLINQGEEDEASETNATLWNIFKNTPREPEGGSNLDTKKYDYTIKAVKISTYIVVFVVVLSSAVISKGTLLLMTSQIKANATKPFCNQHIDVERKYEVTLPIQERVLWVWLLIFVYFIPQIGTFIRSLRVCLFKSWKSTGLGKFFLPLFLTESLPAVGSAILVFSILPELDVLKAAMLTNAFCFVPGLIGLFSRNSKDQKKLDVTTTMIFDIMSVIAQSTSFVMWPLILGNTKLMYLIPLAGILISFGWWENYVDENANISYIRTLAKDRRVFENRTYFLYIFVSLSNCLVFFVTTLMIFWFQDGEFRFLFDNFGEAFTNRKINVTEVKSYFGELTEEGLDDVLSLKVDPTTDANLWNSLAIFIINFLSSYICYAFVKFTSKVSIQEFSFAFAINLTVPVLLSILIVLTGESLKNECNHPGFLPEYLFFNIPPFYLLRDFLQQQYVWVWILWLFSQVWITLHIWNPKCEKLARTEKLFVRPMYDAFLIDQSVCMNRRRDDSPLKADKIDLATTPRVYVCATMWHENGEEMMTFLKSIMRLDEDHCAHRIAKYFMHIDVPTYYELECNIFFDDAFIRKSKTDQDPMLNSYVLEMISRTEKAASEVHGVNIKLRSPKILATPYGGRLEWTLPGRTKLIVHLKDKAKIRAKKRWSQVMYMYYLLGHRLMDNPAVKKKLETAENTFILALDGDIDFKPEAMHLLIEYMKKNKKLGAACGRIHPVGSGAIAWYQVFEYAVGHWMQKSTEHVIGCVLCSPGCFSLFRAEVLMQDRVMCKYTTEAVEARHRVQYDQGEDRWLCTLILQAGYRVEYSAASDSYTHCPEGFNEFFNQRRRWIPSTFANSLDVISDYKHIVKTNDDISMIYIFYQVILMIGTIIGPGTIFLMLIGAAVSVFQVDQWTSFLVNLMPILVFVLICIFCKDDVQLTAAAILSSIYGLIMMAVLIGVLLQIHDDGLLAPSSLFFFFMITEFVVAAILHPKEYYCLKYGIIYYVTVPSMYMLLMIFSVFNMNNVTWGTRDVTVVPSDKEKNANEEKKNSEEKDKKETGIFSFLTNDKTKIEDGSLELSFAGLFKCLFCTHQSDEYNKLKSIQKAIESLNEKLDALQSGKITTITAEPSNNNKIIKKEEIKSNIQEKKTEEIPAKNIIMENSWFYHNELLKGRVKWLDDREEKFWNSLIKKYLEPIDETDKKHVIAKELKDLRDKMVFTFFMVNALFVLVIFLLTLKKDIIHIDWPYNPKMNFTYIDSENEVLLMKDYLHLEPIGFVFLLTFGALLLIQSFGMFVHRFQTFCQIISNTVINWKILEPDVENDPDALKYVTKDNAIPIAKKLQQLYDVNKSKEEIENEKLSPGKRKSVFIPNGAEKKDVQIYDLVESYRARMKMYDDEDFKGPVDKKTVAHIKYKHSEVVRKSQAHLFKTNGENPVEMKTLKFYDMPPIDENETFL